CDYIETDLRNTTAVLAGVARTLDLSRPVAVLLLAVLHFLADTDDPAAGGAALARRLGPGRFLGRPHPTAAFAPGPAAARVGARNTVVPTTLVPRSHAQVSALFGGLSLVPPGVVPITEWRPAIVSPSPTPPTCTPVWPVPPGNRP